jgi:very-short-patch-repair endonuclease
VAKRQSKPWPARTQLACIRCSGTFTVSASQLGRRYCSYQCCADHRRESGAWPASGERLVRACEVCAAPMSLPPSRSAARYCSQACIVKWRERKFSGSRYRPEAHVTVNCGWCGATFSTLYCRLKSGRGRYCSATCRASYSARRCQNRVSGEETRFGDALRRAGMEPLPQHRIGRWTVDFYFPSWGIAVEFDGEYWHSLPRMIEKDQRKAAYLRGRKVALVRVPERLWLDAPDRALGLVSGAITQIKTMCRAG